MFDFEFEYKDRRSISINGINEVIYRVAGFEEVVRGQDILTHKFPVNLDLQLKGTDRNYSISHDGLLKISIMPSAN